MRIFKLLSVLLDYPGDGMLEAVRELAAGNPQAMISSTDSTNVLEKAEQRVLADFVTAMLGRDTTEIQSEYVQTFDLTAEHSLHLTHHIFGEEKTRGPALIDLGEFYRSYGLKADEKELPDYLPVILEFVSTLNLDEARVFLADVAKVLKVLAENLEKSGSAYAPLVRIIEKQGSLARLAA